MATLSKGLAKLRTQVNTRFPNRDTASDGWIGDAAHSARTSDHNPDRHGIVHALDLDRDMGKPGTAEILVAQLVAYGKSGRKGSGRLKYVIFEGRIYSKTYGFKSQPYKGSNPHNHHIHISATTASDTEGTAWPLPILQVAK